MDALYRYQKKTGETPQAFLDRPPIPTPEVDFLLTAFRTLSGFRGSNGFGLNPLSYSDVVLYADRVGLDRQAEFFFVEAMSAMDQAFLDIMAEKIKSQST